MTDKQTNQTWRSKTRAVRSGTNRSQFQETSEAMFMTSGYAYDSAEQAERRFKDEEAGFIYSRFGNPTVGMFEDRMAALEGIPAARATATGMAAVTATMLCHLSAGDHVVSAKALFGSCRFILDNVLPRFGIEVTLVDGPDLNQWEDAVQPNTKVLFLETPANPTLEIIDLRSVADIAHKAGARLIVDNVFATPILQRPHEFGADVTVYSATKHIDGQGRCLGGVILCKEDFLNDHLHSYLRNTGPALSPFNAWVLLKSLETLDLRVHEHCRSAVKVADFLAEQPHVTRLLYPHREDHPQYQLAKTQMEAGGNVVTFEVNGGKEAAFRFENALTLVDISNNLGDAKSLITHPATTTHSRLTPEARAELGITDSMVRLSVGLEDSEDICEDLGAALANI